MDLQNTFKSKTSFYTCIIFIIFTTLANQTQSLDPKFEACVPRTCGKGPNISYPFWILGEQDSFCGYPNFEITCNDKNPVLNISSDEFIIKDIFYANYSFRVANAAVYEDTCPTPLHNISLDRTPFSFIPTHADFFILYNCTEKPEEYFTYPVNCASNATHYSFAGFHEKVFERTNYSLESCQSLVNVPMNVSSDLDRLLGMSYTDVLEVGFLLNWTAHSCSSCDTSGGRCGFDNNEFVCFCQDRPHLKTCADGHGMKLWKKPAIGIGAGVAGILFMCIIIFCFKTKTSSLTSTIFFRKDQDLEAFIRSYGTLALKRYSFSSIKKMTNSFKDKLGQGGYGGVYKGKLLDGRLVAVKVLNASKGNGEEFINEVASISRTSHVNIVTLLGFCLEGRKRALIYKFMPNGSLEKFIHNDNTLKSKNKSQHLGWEKLYQIAIGIARGLEYLHRGCNTRILHFDIKPHNILLDEDFCPKISDFGLAKLCTRKESIISMLEARGTIGYIAPEVFSRNFGGVSHKSDVYSYGMMVLEMVGGSKNINVGVNHSSEIYFPHWVYKRLEVGIEFEWHGVTTDEETEIVRKMILVGLWCIQTSPSDRPSMSKVIEMLEGSIGALEIPPRPFLSSPPRSPPPKSPNSDPSTTSLS